MRSLSLYATATSTLTQNPETRQENPGDRRIRLYCADHANLAHFCPFFRFLHQDSNLASANKAWAPQDVPAGLKIPQPDSVRAS